MEETCLSVGAPGLMHVGGGGAPGEGSGDCDRRLILSVLLTDPSEPPVLGDVAAGA